MNQSLSLQSHRGTFAARQGRLGLHCKYNNVFFLQLCDEKNSEWIILKQTIQYYRDTVFLTQPLQDMVQPSFLGMTPLIYGEY